MPDATKRFAEVSWDGESFVVILWKSFGARINSGEQEFSELNTDAELYIKRWTLDGVVIF